ncbi:bifunctional metallophosphatase/5'-nucleotidase [Halobium salinum]|uniref:Bifunctional metallophosphatase/5'-nucleotidase n=1 Tax=Halobium salinum TaxID=1364940 RepID=A0ABD5PE20_9EURY|nr:bifunctional metallophosphatase/5'-nucleotidase [Halobium salinum]
MVRLLHYSDIENVYDDPERAGRLAGRLRDLDGEDALVVGTGDDTAPGVLALVARGGQALDFFEAVDARVETFGNHDFDFGVARARQLAGDAPQTWVSANVRDEDGDRFGADVGVVPWTVEEVAGERVGLFGLTDPATPSINPMATDLTFTDPYEAAAEAVDALRERGVDHVVCCSHLGAGDDELARRFDLDAVLGGHVHSERAEHVDGTLCTRPGVNGHVVLEVELGSTGDGNDDSGRATATRHPAAGAPVDERLAAALEARMAESGLRAVVATVDDPIERTEETVFGGECRIGNLVADAYRWAADADVGIQNSGGVRTGPALAGEVTTGDLVSVLPFEEHVVVAELTGRELEAVFREFAGARLDFGEPDWWHGHVSGAELVWDDTAGELVAARVGGDPVDPEATYRVATSEYLLHTDHELPTLGARHRAGEYGIQHEVLAAYVRETGAAVDVEGRMRRVNARGDADDASTGVDATDSDADTGAADSDTGADGDGPGDAGAGEGPSPDPVPGEAGTEE